MSLFANRQWQIGLGLAAAMSALGAFLVAVKLISLAVSLPPVHAPLPDAVLLTETKQIAWPSIIVTRQYRALAPYRDAVAWYQGKDSLMPLAPVLKPGCFQQSFSRRSAILRQNGNGGVEEDVETCFGANGVSITSVTTIHYPIFTP